jgi:hypothetical protein
MALFSQVSSYFLQGLNFHRNTFPNLKTIGERGAKAVSTPPDIFPLGNRGVGSFLCAHSAVL